MKKRFLLITTCLTVFSLSWQIPPANENWREKIDPRLLQKAEQGETVDFIVLLKEQADVSASRNLKNKAERGAFAFGELKKKAAQTQAPLVQLLQAEGAVFKSYLIVNAIHTTGNFSLLKKLAELPAVALIQGNYPVRMEEPLEPDYGNLRGPTGIEWGIDTIDAELVWDLGFTGQGAVVGGQDTGYEWQHPALKNKYRGYFPTTDTFDHNYNWHDAIHQLNPLNNDSIPDPNNNPCGLNVTQPCDDHNHGTHTMGTMIGSDGDNLIGVATGAQWCACRNMERGWGSPATYMECFQWFIAPTDLNGENPDPAKAPHVINNSWSCPPIEGCDSLNSALMEMVVNNVKAAGIVVVVSAGNSGSSCGSVSAPAATFENSFTVGATRLNDTIAGYSSRGPVFLDGSLRLKPNVAAPGSGVRSAIRGGNYANFSGTSMAGPHVAGLVALMISANPDLAGQVETIESIIEQTARHKTDTTDCGTVDGDSIPNNTYGYGRIDALAAVKAALALVTETKEPLPAGGAPTAYPNPFREAFIFDFSKSGNGQIPSGAVLEIFSATGKSVRRDVIPAGIQGKWQVSMGGFPSGVYFYKIKNGKKLWEGKLVKTE
jgi:subtilisin family serine protease